MSCTDRVPCLEGKWDDYCDKYGWIPYKEFVNRWYGKEDKMAYLSGYEQYATSVVGNYIGYGYYDALSRYPQTFQFYTKLPKLPSEQFADEYVAFLDGIVGNSDWRNEK